MSLAQSGDQDAFERIYRRHVARVTRLGSWLIDGGDVDDAVQEVFIRVWQKLHTFAGQSSFGTWLHRVAVNLMLRRRRTLRLMQQRHSGSEDDLGSVAGRVERPDLRIAIERAMDRLPAGAREVFVLHDMEGYKHEEIGQLLGVDAGTSRSQLHRARMLLRQLLAG